VDEGTLRERVDGLLGGRDVIVTSFAVRGTVALVEGLRGHGAGRVLVLAAGEGTGPRPEGVEAVVVPTPVRSMTEEVLALESLVDRMGPEHHAALDAWDPDRTALVLGNAITTGAAIGGRPVVGHRRPAWADLEDKGTVDELLAGACVPAPDHEVVLPDEVAAAAARLDRGEGVVLAAGGRNGGGDGVRRVAVEEAEATARHLVGAFAGARGPGLGRVRVATFVEGTPCSIGALVTADGVAVLRPVENITLRQGRRFAYSGLATTYDPPPPVGRAMEAAARRVGETLRRRVGYRGGFAIDGIVTASPGGGWLATEVNTRFSGGFATHPSTRAETVAPDLHLVHVALVEGLAYDVLTAATVEAVYRPPAEAVRCVRVARVLPAVPVAGPATVDVVVEGRTVRVAEPGEVAHGSLMVGEAAMGGVVLARLTDADRPLDRGASAAPVAVALLDLADELWGTGTAGLTPPAR
jgi:hypothetical protein